MKYATAIALLPLLACAAPSPAGIINEARDASADDEASVIKFEGFVNGQTVPFVEGAATYVGQENGTDVSLFRFPDQQTYSVNAVQGDPITKSTGWWIFKTTKNIAVNPRTGLCENCVDESGDKQKKREIEERTLGLLIGLLALKGRFLLNWSYGWNGYYSGCLSGFENHGWAWVGCGNDRWPRQQCGITGGYLHHQNIPHLGWVSPWGGKYCGSLGGIPHWDFGGRVCPHTVRRHRHRPGCSTPQVPQRPPICSSCNRGGNGYKYWTGGNNGGYFQGRKNWWNGNNYGYQKRATIENLD